MATGTTPSCAIFKNVFREFPWYTNGVNGFVTVQDVAALSVLMLESSVSGERFIINGENWPFRKLFNSIADGFTKKHPASQTGYCPACSHRMANGKNKIYFSPEFLHC